MKLTQATKTFETNAELTSQDFTIGDVSVVIEILRNKLYRHKVRTLVQEYISNGRDAMREIASKGQIDIVLPTMFEPTFKVRDYGPGISPDRMYNVFIKYASSTKRKNNLQTGGFGIGAKSAWSYTESFTIVTFIDGIQRSYVAHIGANNNGRLDYLGETKTKEPNGTEIQIPVNPRDITEFKQSAYRAVYFWDKSEYPNFKNVPKSDIETYNPGDMLSNLEVNNGLPDFIIGKYDTGLVLSIDGIPYVLSQSLSDKVPSLKALTDLVTGQLVLHLKTGDIEVAASREEVADSKQTQDALESVAKQTLGVIKAKLTKEFSQATTPFEHLQTYKRLADLYNLNNYRKFGDFIIEDGRGDDKVISSNLFDSLKIERCEMPAPKYDLKKESLSKKGRRSWYSKKPLIKYEWIDKLYFTDGSEPALIVNYRIKALCQAHGDVIVFSKENTTNVNSFNSVISALGVKDLKTVPYVKPARKTAATIKIERTKQQFVLHDLGRYSHQARTTSLADNTKQWLWVDHAKLNSRMEYLELAEYLLKQGLHLCALGQDAQRRVKGDANFKPLKDFLAKVKLNKGMIAALKHEKASQHDTISKLKSLKGLTDKTVSDMIEEYKTFEGKQEVIPEMIKKIIGEPDEVKDFVKADKEFKAHLIKTYPLLEDMSWNWSGKVNDEIVSYMNSK